MKKIFLTIILSFVGIFALSSCKKNIDIELKQDINDAITVIEENGVLDSIINNWLVEGNTTSAYKKSSTNTEKNGTLKVATSANFAPYEFKDDNNNIIGLDIDVMQAICDVLNKKLVIEDMNFDSVIASVVSGKCDIAISGITVTEERKKSVDFSNTYITASQVIITNDNNVTSSEDLVGKVIGVQQGTIGDDLASEIENAKVDRYKTGNDAINALNQGKVDAVIIDNAPAKKFVDKNPGLIILEETLSDEDYAIAIAKENNQNIFERINNTLISNNGWKMLLKGLGTTILISFLSIILGLIIGFVVAIIRTTHDKTGRWKVADKISKAYLAIFRGTPVVVQLLIIYFGIFATVNVSKIFVAVVAFGINSGAYVAEIVRSGIMSIDDGQFEAGSSLGMSYGKTMIHIILPQSIKNILPALGNEFIVLLKETSIAGYIAIFDLTKAGDQIRSSTYEAFIPLIAVAIIYLIMVMGLSKLISIFERRLAKNDKRQ